MKPSSLSLFVQNTVLLALLAVAVVSYACGGG